MHKPPNKGSHLRDRIRTFSISFRLRPILDSASGERLEIGCEVELIGQHYSMGRHVNGGCPHCLDVLLALLDLHDLAFSEPQTAEYPSRQYEKLIHYASTSADWPEVVLDVKICWRPTPIQVSNNSAIELTEEIRTELLDLGCHELLFAYVPAVPVSDWRCELAGRAV